MASPCLLRNIGSLGRQIRVLSSIATVAVLSISPTVQADESSDYDVVESFIDTEVKNVDDHHFGPVITFCQTSGGEISNFHDLAYLESYNSLSADRRAEIGRYACQTMADYRDRQRAEHLEEARAMEGTTETFRKLNEIYAQGGVPSCKTNVDRYIDDHVTMTCDAFKEEIVEIIQEKKEAARDVEIEKFRAFVENDKDLDLETWLEEMEEFEKFEIYGFGSPHVDLDIDLSAIYGLRGRNDVWNGSEAYQDRIDDMIDAAYKETFKEVAKPALAEVPEVEAGNIVSYHERYVALEELQEKLEDFAHEADMEELLDRPLEKMENSCDEIIEGSTLDDDFERYAVRGVFRKLYLEDIVCGAALLHGAKVTAEEKGKFLGLFGSSEHYLTFEMPEGREIVFEMGDVDGSTEGYHKKGLSMNVDGKKIHLRDREWTNCISRLTTIPGREGCPAFEG